MSSHKALNKRVDRFETLEGEANWVRIMKNRSDSCAIRRSFKSNHQQTNQLWR